MWHPVRVFPSRIGNSVKRNLACFPTAFSFVLFVAAFLAGISSGVATSLSHLAPNTIGVAAAISSQVFGLKGHPYEGYKSVLTAMQKAGIAPTPENFPQNFRNYALLTSALHSAQSADITGSELISIASNDQGALEYTHAAFLLFGIDVKSLYYLYFVILGASVAAYLLSFWRDYVACTVLFATACAIYSFMPGFLFREEQLMSVATPRFLSTLGIIPLLHISFLVVRGNVALRWSSVISIIIQASVLSFAYTARSTSSWMFLTLLVLVAYYLARILGPTFKQRTIIFVSSVMRHRGVIILLVLTTVTVLQLGRSMFVPRGDLYSHFVWHEVFYGFQFSPDWNSRFAAQYNYATHDSLSYTAAEMYAQAHHNIPHRTNAEHDAVMRSVVFQFIYEHPIFALKSFLVDRPHSFIGPIYNFANVVYSSVPDYMFFAILGMCCCLGILGSVNSIQYNFLTFLSAVCVLVLSFAVSLDSVFVAYSDKYLISDQAFLLVAIIVSLLIWTFTKAFQYIKQLTMARQYKVGVPNALSNGESL